MNVTAAQTCDDLMRLLNGIKAAALTLAETHNITKVQFFALYFIDEQGKMSMGQIADALHCDASNITGIVDRLVVQGLVVRQENPVDRRTKNLHLTAKGQEVIARLKAELPVQLGCDKLDTAERESLHRIMQKVCV